MTLEITSKSINLYQLDWMGSIGDFVKWLEKTDSEYIKVIDAENRMSALKISEIESISVIEEE